MTSKTHKNIINYFLFLGYVLITCACVPIQDSTSKKTIKKSSLSEKAAAIILQGNFIDSPVAGIEYSSGEVSGVTDSSGLFQYQLGKKIIFKVGDIKLGVVDGAKTITPITLVEDPNIQINTNNPKVINIVRFLTTLDDDSDPTNGIKLSDSVRANSKNKSINFDQPTSTFEASVQTNIDLIKGGPTTIKTASEAQIHLTNTLANLVPEAPRGLIGLPDFGEILLSWDNAESATSYNLYYSREPQIGIGNNFNPFKTIRIPNAKGPFLLKNLENGVRYFFTVTGINSKGEGLKAKEFNSVIKIPFIKLDQNPLGSANLLSFTVQNCSGVDEVLISEGLFSSIGVWNNRSDLNIGREASATTSFNNLIYAIGGRSFSGLGTLNQIEVYDQSINSWTNKSPMGQARKNATANALNGKIYVTGGNGDSFSVAENTVEEYDIYNDSWRFRSPLNISRTMHSSVTFNGKIYVFGGYGGAPFPYVEVYDPNLNTWTNKTSMPVAVYGSTAQVVHDKIYVIGGFTNSGATGAVQVYDPVNNTWTTKANIPNPRVFLNSAVIDNKINVFGGWIPSQNTHSLFINIYNPSTNLWTSQLSNVPPVGFSKGVSLNNRMYSIGGKNGSATVQELTLQDGPPPINHPDWVQCNTTRGGISKSIPSNQDYVYQYKIWKKGLFGVSPKPEITIKYIYDSTPPSAPEIQTSAVGFFRDLDLLVTQGGTPDNNFKNFHYTTDTTDPTCETGIVTNGPIKIPKGQNKTLKVISCDQANNSSTISTTNYTYVAPPKIDNISLFNPVTSPNPDRTPSIIINGVGKDEVVRLYSNNSCSTQISSSLSPGTSVTLTTSALSLGTYIIYTNTTNEVGTSPCSTVFLNYEVLDPPTTPTSIALLTPASSPANDSTPTFRIGGVKSGETIKIHKNSTCTSEVASFSSLGVTADITTNQLTDGTYIFYTNANNGVGISPCSTFSSVYFLDATPPSKPSVQLLSPTSPGIDTTPIIKISGLSVGDTVQLFNNSNCTTLNSSFTANSISKVFTPSPITDGSYIFSANATDSLGNISACSTVNANYILSQPGNRAPSLAQISSQTVQETQAITQININDVNSGNDNDIDGSPITYSCFYDNLIDQNVGATNCASLTGISLNTSTGLFNWTPNGTQKGNYEFKILASDGTNIDQIFFSIIVNELNQPPVLAAISNFVIFENQALPAIDTKENSTNSDLDIDGQALTYTCYFDTVVDSSVASTNACTSLIGVSFNRSNGIFAWTPNHNQEGSYEFKIIGTDSTFSDSELFSVTVNNTNRAPALADISNIITNENQEIDQINLFDSTTGGDQDIDGNTITYTCFYDLVVNNNVASILSCTSLSGVVFNSSEGTLNWTPNYSQSNIYEFKITGTDGNLSNSKIFSLQVIDSNRAPKLAAVNGQTIQENQSITTIDIKDSNTNNDTDIDGQGLIYSCLYDDNIDSEMVTPSNCNNLQGLVFSPTNGLISWTTDLTQSGNYEFQITASDGSLSDSIFLWVVVENTNVPPDLFAVLNQTVTENSPISQININNKITFNDTDQDGDVITYTCFYDNLVDGAVGTDPCSQVTGLNFVSNLGVMAWTPNFDQSGTYEFKVIGTSGGESDLVIFSITVNNFTNAPSPPSNLTLIDPSSSPGFSKTPIIEISGVKNGDTVKIFSDSSCLTEKGSELSIGSSVEITSSSLNSGDQNYTFYANTTDSEGTSLCTSNALNYNLITLDTLFSTQWHLDNTGQMGATPGEDANVLPVWESGNKGEGILIAVVDDGIEIDHPDLQANITSGSYNYFTLGNDPSPVDDDDGHGTSVAGVIAATDLNGLGVSGAAPEAKVVGYNLVASLGSIDDNEVDAMTRNITNIDISNNSWGDEDQVGDFWTATNLWKSSIDTGITTGRDGKGTLYVWAGGNGKVNRFDSDVIADRSDYDGRANYYGVLAVAAISDRGKETNYSEKGSNIFISAHSSADDGISQGITTTDLVGGTRGFNKNSSSNLNDKNYTNNFGGTSSAAPLVSGVIALMLKENPNLGWRDVKQILAETARKNDSSHSDWGKNGADLFVNHAYGFGAIDAEAAVNKAKTWTNLGTMIVKTFPSTGFKTINKPINDLGTMVSDSISIANSGITKIEFVSIELNLRHDDWGNLAISLNRTGNISSKSVLAEPHSCFNYLSDNTFENRNCTVDGDIFRFGSTRHLNEPADGTWSISINDQEGNNGNSDSTTGTAVSWRIKIYGR